MSLILRTSKHVLVTAGKQFFLSHHSRSVYSICTLSRIKHRYNHVARFGTARRLQTRCLLLNDADAKTHYSLSSNAQPSSNTLIHLRQDLYKLDYDARHLGRLQEVEVEKMFTAMKEIGSIESCDGLQIIRCCGSLIPEMPADLRTKLVQEIWKTLPKLSCQYDVSHYNALLKVYLENEHRFDPIEFLKSMEEHGVPPNRVTYQHMVSRYSQDGEIEGAKSILEFMKTKNIPVNEQIFNDLIFGHAKANNMENATEILKVMKNSELSPSSATFSALACGYALIGDIEKVLATLDEVEANGSSLQDKDILRIIHTLAVNQHGHLVQQVIPKLQFQPGYNNKCFNAVLELVNRGHHAVAYALLSTMPKKNSNVQFGLTFIQQLVKQGLAPDVIIEYCTKISGGEQMELPLLKAAETALKLRKTEDALIYYHQLHSQNFMFRPHLFWPMLIQNKGNDESIYNILKIMLEKNCPANFDTLLHYTIPNISISDSHAFITRLQDMGYDISDIVNPFCAYFLLNYEIQVAAELLERYSVKCSGALLASRWLAFAFIKSQDTDSTVKILDLCEQNPLRISHAELDISGLFILDLLTTNECSDSLLENLLTVLNEKGKKLCGSSVATIMKNHGDKIGPHIRPMLYSLASSEIHVPTSNGKEFSTRQKRTDELYRLLVLYTKNKDLEKVKDLLKEMEQSNFIYHGNTYLALMQVFCHHKDVENAMHYKKLIDTECPDFKIDIYKLIALATLLAENKMFDDAEMIITSYHSKFGETSDKNMIHNVDVYKLLIGFGQSDDVGRTRKLFEKLLDFGYCTASKAALGCLVKAYILQNDLPGAVDEFLRIVNTYQVTPCKSELFRKLIQMENPEILQKVLDAAMTIHGQAMTMLDLAEAFNDCGQSKQAMKVIKDSGVRLQEGRINQVCENYVERNMVKELESFVQITRDVPGLDRDYMYYQLLRAHANAKNVEKALDVWLVMQEENVHPSHRTMHFLGAFLQSMDQPVPFAMPMDKTTSSTTQSMDQPVPFAMPMDKTTSSTTQNKPRINGLSDVDASSLIDVTLKNNELSEAVRLTDEILSAGLSPVLDVIYRLADKLNSVGDTKNLTYLEARLPQRFVKKIPLKAYLVNCFSKVEQAEEFLNSLETDISKHKKHFPLGSILILLEEKPRVLDRVKKLVDMYYQEGISEPRKFLWMHLMNNKKFEEADETFRSTPEMNSHMFFWSVAQNIKKSNDVEISQKLLDVVKNTEIPNREKGIVFSAHINVLVSLNKIEEALNIVKESQSFIKLEQLNRGALTRLKEHLIMAGMAVPFTVPQDVRASKDNYHEVKY